MFRSLRDAMGQCRPSSIINGHYNNIDELGDMSMRERLEDLYFTL